MHINYSWSFGCSASIVAAMLALTVGCSAPEKGAARPAAACRCVGNLDGEACRTGENVRAATDGRTDSRACPFPRHRYRPPRGGL